MNNENSLIIKVLDILITLLIFIGILILVTLTSILFGMLGGWMAQLAFPQLNETLIQVTEIEFKDLGGILGFISVFIFLTTKR